jgi:hypothetical protein
MHSLYTLYIHLTLDSVEYNHEHSTYHTYQEYRNVESDQKIRYGRTETSCQLPRPMNHVAFEPKIGSHLAM